MEIGGYEEINWLLGRQVEERVIKYIGPHFLLLKANVCGSLLLDHHQWQSEQCTTARFQESELESSTPPVVSDQLRYRTKDVIIPKPTEMKIRPSVT